MLKEPTSVHNLIAIFVGEFLNMPCQDSITVHTLYITERDNTGASTLSRSNTHFVMVEIYNMLEDDPTFVHTFYL